jgi:hypothetical protein
MPRLDTEYLTTEPAPARRATRPRPAPAKQPAPHHAEDAAVHPPAAESGNERPDGLGAILWPAATTFAMVFAAGLYLFWLRHPGQQPAAPPPVRGVVLPPFALVAGWVAAVRPLPRILPRALAWIILAAATVFVAIVMSRELTAWLRAAFSSAL